MIFVEFNLQMAHHHPPRQVELVQNLTPISASHDWH
jgi:hypothetical protein